MKTETKKAFYGIETLLLNSTFGMVDEFNKAYCFERDDVSGQYHAKANIVTAFYKGFENPLMPISSLYSETKGKRLAMILGSEVSRLGHRLDGALKLNIKACVDALKAHRTLEAFKNFSSTG